MTGHIQVGGASPRVQYTANGTQAAFSFPFPIFTASDLEVWVGRAMQSATAYTLSGVGISAGGSVLFITPPPSGSKVTLRRRLLIQRVTDYQEDGIIRAKLLNDELDVQTASIQQVAEDASRAVTRSFLSADTADLTLPEPQPGKALGWNADGTGLTNDPADFVATTAAIAALSAQTASDRAIAQTMASAAQTARAACDADVAITGDDRTVIAADRSQVAVDRAQVASDRAAIAADRAQVAADKAAVHADRIATDGDATQIAADRVQVAADKAQVAADRTSVAADRTAAAASATAAHASELSAAASAAAASAAASGGAVKVSAADTVADYLSASLAAGSNITLSVQNAGANETLRISVSGLTTVATSGAYADLSGKPVLGSASSLAATTSTTLSGNSDANLPTEKAVKAYVDAAVAVSTSTDPYPDIGQLYLSLARLDTPTSPNVGGTQVADEFDSTSGIAGLGGATLASGYLSNPGGYTSGLIPTMTTNTAPSGTASASNNSANAYLAFDGNASGTMWESGVGVPSWLQYQFSSAQTVTKYVITACGTGWGASVPTGWTFQGSNSGTAWTTLDSKTGLSVFADNESRTFTLSNATSYTYYRFNWTEEAGNAGGQQRLGAVQLHASASSANITTISNAYAASAVPSTVSLVAEYQDVAGGSVVNTDIIFEVSRDNGTTWNSVSMADFGPSIVTGARVLKGTVSVASQPSGTSLKWGIRTLNAKEQRVHGIWMQWK